MVRGLANAVVSRYPRPVCNNVALSYICLTDDGRRVLLLLQPSWIPTDWVAVL